MFLKKYREQIRSKLMVIYLIPILVLISVFGISFYIIMENGLETELSKRLISIGQSAASQLNTSSLIMLLPGDEDSRLFQNIQNKLLYLKELNEISRIYIFTPNNKSIVDTNKDIKIGDVYLRHTFDQEELNRVLKGETASSVLFTGEDDAFYKTGYVPLKNNTGNIVIIGVEGNADFFQTLKRIRSYLMWMFILVAGFIVGASFIFARKIDKPVKNLVKAATKISEGDLNTTINIIANDELGVLGHKFNEMRQKLLERDNRMQMMLHGIAHEVRNPLGGIELFAGLLEEEQKNNPASKDYIKKIKKEVKNLSSIVNEFLDYAKRINLDKRQINLEKFIKDISIFFKKEMDDAKIKFHTQIETCDQSVIFDPDYMRRVFLNLFKNSVQALPYGGTISCKARLQNNGTGNIFSKNLEINFIDDGVGIKEEDLNKLFTPFFTTKEKGTGLGLSFAQKIITEHGGEIKIKSEFKKGTQITIILPM